jgi:alkanesulfonate monooxygenase SsuD/methylene tetrahydromethanopterin reductase-like flavin-dependent oxidoreductase (luciferase family)
MQSAEGAGFDDGWVFDNHIAAMEPYSLLGVIATATSDLRLGTCVTNPSSRHPTVTASSIATLNALSGGRMLLGIGRGDSAVRLVGQPPASLATLETSIRVIRTLVAGGTAMVDGVDVNLPWVEGYDLPVWVAGYGPKVLDLAARVADGVVLQLGDVQILEVLIGYLRDRERVAGRPPGSCRVMVAMPAHVGDVAEGVELMAWFPRFLRHHFVEATKHWRDQASGLGDAYLAEESEAGLAELTKRSCLIGGPDDHLRRIESLQSLGVDNVNLYLVDRGQKETILEYGANILPHVTTQPTSSSA